MLSNGSTLNLDLEIEGKKCLSSGWKKVDWKSYIDNTCNYLNYIERCRIISKFFDIPILFESDFPFTAQEYRKIYKVVEIIQGNAIYTKDNVTNMVCKMDVENTKIIKELTGKPATMQYRVDGNEQIKLFNTILPLPPKTITVIHVIPKLKMDNNSDESMVEFIPCDGFSLKISFMNKYLNI